jgi:nucleoside-diphosphate-sugar epimerase
MASRESYAIKLGKRILVTGANGFISSKVVDFLLSLGYIVRGTVRSEKPWLEEIFEAKYGEERFELHIVLGLVDEEVLVRAIGSVSGIVYVGSISY